MAKRNALGSGLRSLIPENQVVKVSPNRGVDALVPPRPGSAPAPGADSAPSGEAATKARAVHDLLSPAPRAKAGRKTSRASSPAKAAPAQPAAQSAAQSASEPELVAVPGLSFAQLEPADIEPNARQPRTNFDEDELAELVASIREVGVLQPVVVRKKPGFEKIKAGQPRFELIMGERRWRASQQAGLSEIPAIIRDTADEDLLRDALLENLHRANLNPLEEASAYAQLLEDFSCTQEELARRLARSRPQITNTLRLLKLPPAVQVQVAAGVLSAGHARALLALPEAQAMEALANRIISEGLSVRSTEEIIAMGEAPSPAQPSTGPKPAPQLPEAAVELREHLEEALETRVRS